MLLEQYRMLTEEEFIELYKSCIELYIELITFIANKQIEKIPAIIERLLHFRLVDLKAEYELLVLLFIKLAYGVQTTDNQQLQFIIQKFRHKRNDFIDIMNDYRNYDMFDSDIRFTSFIWLLTNKLANLL